MKKVLLILAILLGAVAPLSDDEPYDEDEFIGRVKTNPLAFAVKINDLTNNRMFAVVRNYPNGM